jgi:hypothetical protein
MNSTNPVDYSDWFARQLAAGAEGLAWAAEQVPAERARLRPPSGLGEWPASRHIFHMLFYEETLALPAMRQWLGGPLPHPDEADEDLAWEGGQRVEDVLPRFRAVRDEQIALLPHLARADWELARDTLWGPVSLAWVVTKTYQHTNEHISDVLRIALFWEVYSAREKMSMQSPGG